MAGLRTLTAALVVSVFTAGSTQSGMAGLRAGMSPAQVDALMGPPDRQATDSNRLVKRYDNHPTLSEQPNAANYAAMFEDGDLVQWGAGGAL